MQYLTHGYGLDPLQILNQRHRGSQADDRRKDIEVYSM
jgi:hypothetical protein